MTLDALHLGMRRIPIRGYFRIHRVAGFTTELRRLHVLDRSIGKLSSDKHIQKGGDAEKPGQGV